MIDDPVLYVAELDEPEFGTAVGDEILGESTEMIREKATPLQEFHDEIPVVHHVHGVLPDGLETQLLSEEGAVELVGVTGHGSGAERADGDAGDQLAETLEVREK